MQTKALANFIVYIGRFSPPHNGHFSVIRECLTKAHKLIILIGTANAPRTIKNPWFEEERRAMIEAGLTPEELSRVHFDYIPDRLYQNQEWAMLVRSAVRSVLMDFHAGRPETAKVLLAVPAKDSTSWYVNLFPEWEKANMSIHNPMDDSPLAATKIRELLFTGNIGFVPQAMPLSTFNLIKAFSKTDDFTTLKEEYAQAISYEKLYENHPKGHAKNFFTADAIVFQGGHVLLIRRKKSPGKGLWALPGGHVNPNETSREASLRELFEETNIQMQREVIERCLTGEKLFDHPERSMRARVTKDDARTVTMAYCYVLNDAKPLPRVSAGDDAVEAWWFPIETVQDTMSDKLFEDHKHILDYFVSRL